MDKSILILTLYGASLCFQGCGRGPVPAHESAAIELSGRLVQVNSGPAQAMEKHRMVTRKGEQRDSVVLIAPAVVKASLDGAAAMRTLKFRAAPIFNTGDGIQLNVYLQRAGTKAMVCSRYFDAGRKAEDRDWILFDVPLEIREGDQLDIEVSAGPQGDLEADWLALSDVRLTR